MTGGAGFSRDAMNRTKSNRANRTSNRAKFKDGQATYLADSKPLDFKEVSEEELTKIKHEIQERAKNKRTRSLIIGLNVATLVIATGLLLIL